jgi:hypothetical protein
VWHVRQQLAASNFNDAYAFLSTALAAFRAAHALDAQAQAEEGQGGCGSEARAGEDLGATRPGVPCDPDEDALHGDAEMPEAGVGDECIDERGDGEEMEECGGEGGQHGDGAVEKTSAEPGVDARRVSARKPLLQGASRVLCVLNALTDGRI